MDWWSILVYGIIPILSVVIMLFIKRKVLWLSPIISTLVTVIISIIRTPTYITYGEHRTMFLVFVMPSYFVIGIIFTILAYIIGLVLDKRKSK